jgi:hypothetical protein
VHITPTAVATAVGAGEAENLCKESKRYLIFFKFLSMKKYFIGLSIAVVAIVTFAFTTTKKESKKVFDSWYEYRSTSQDEADLLNENLYFLVTNPSGCSSDENICAVKVPGTGTHPNTFDPGIEQDILDAVTNEAPVSGYIEMKP